jgi:hypothetical protein
MPWRLNALEPSGYEQFERPVLYFTENLWSLLIWPADSVGASDCPVNRTTGWQGLSSWHSSPDFERFRACLRPWSSGLTHLLFLELGSSRRRLLISKFGSRHLLHPLSEKRHLEHPSLLSETAASFFISSLLLDILMMMAFRFVHEKHMLS